MGAKPRTPKAIQFKKFPALVMKVEALSDSEGVVEAFVAVIGNLDDGRDIIHPGAFVKTIAERGHRLRVLDNHQTNSTVDSIAKITQIREVKRVELPEALLDRTPDARGGLFVRTQFMIDNPTDKSYQIFQRLKAGFIDEWSIGFNSMQEDFSKIEVNGEKITVRNIRQIQLWECSPVIFAMNPATMTTQVKNTDDDEVIKKAVPKQALPLADRERAWDSGAAIKRVKTWAGGPAKEDMDWPKYRKAFFWYDDSDVENFGSYKLPYADVINDELTAVPRGIFAAAGAVSGARGGVDMGDDEMAVKGVIEKWYAQMAREFDDDTIVTPWEKMSNPAVSTKEWTPDGPIQRFGDVLRSSLHRAVSTVADDWLFMGLLTTEEHQIVLDLLDTSLTTFVDGLPEDLALRPWDIVMWHMWGGRKPAEQGSAEPESVIKTTASLTPSALELQRRRSLALAQAQLALIDGGHNG